MRQTSFLDWTEFKDSCYPIFRGLLEYDSLFLRQYQKFPYRDGRDEKIIVVIVERERYTRIEFFWLQEAPKPDVSIKQEFHSANTFHADGFSTGEMTSPIYCPASAMHPRRFTHSIEFSFYHVLLGSLPRRRALLAPEQLDIFVTPFIVDHYANNYTDSSLEFSRGKEPSFS